MRRAPVDAFHAVILRTHTMSDTRRDWLNTYGAEARAGWPYTNERRTA